jgi:hypothetical protein
VSPKRRLLPLLAFLASFLTTLAGVHVRPAHAEMASLPAHLVALDSAEGERLLIESKARRDFFPLTRTFVAQRSQTTCALASSAMVLNALDLPAPEVPAWSPYRSFTEDNLFNDEARRLGVARSGLTLDQLGVLLSTHPTSVRVVHAGDVTLDELRRTVAAAVADDEGFVIVNFLRSALGEEPNGSIERSLAGHHSPVAAYHEGSDRFLLLDVARYKYPPAWVEAQALYAAMNTVDVDSGKTRGIVITSALRGTPKAAVASSSGGRLPYIAAGLALAFTGLGFVVGTLVARRRARRASGASSGSDQRPLQSAGIVGLPRSTTRSGSSSGA